MSSLPDEYLSNLSDAQKDLLNKLNSNECGQSHLFEGWGSLSPKERQEIATKIEQLDKAYNNGGLAGYINNAKKLLENSKNGVNPLDGWAPNIPEGEAFELGTDKYKTTEEKGLTELGSIGFVLVAGTRYQSYLLLDASCCDLTTISFSLFQKVDWVNDLVIMELNWSSQRSWPLKPAI